MSKPKRVLLLIETSQAYGRKIIEGISRYVFENGDWEIDIENRGLLEKIPDWIKFWKGDGIIARSITPSQMKILSCFDIPVIELLGDEIKHKAEVYTDEVSIGRMACEHFLECGLRNFGFISFGNVWWARRRCEAFSRYLSLYGHSCHIYPGVKKDSKSSFSFGNDMQERSTKKWLLELPRPIGVFATNDWHARHVLHACRNLGLSIPRDIAVLGAANDTMLCNLQTPTLSSIDLDAERIGIVAAELLQARMHRRRFKKALPIVIPPIQVVARQSTDTLAVDDPDVVCAIQYIRRNAVNGIKVSDVVQETGLGTSTLFRRIKRVLGHSAEDEIIRIRVEKAKNMLRETHYSVDSIAKKVGFQYSEHFARVFRSVEKMSPSEYRNLYYLPDPSE